MVNNPLLIPYLSRGYFTWGQVDWPWCQLDYWWCGLTFTSARRLAANDDWMAVNILLCKFIALWGKTDAGGMIIRKIPSSYMQSLRICTVDGSEFRRSPVEVGSLSHYLQGFIHPSRLFAISSINSSSLKSLGYLKKTILIQVSG